VRQAYDGARQTLAQIDTQDKALRDRRADCPWVVGGCSCPPPEVP